MVRLWDVSTGKERRILGRVKTNPHGPGATHPAAFSPDGKLLAAGSADGTISVWETATGKERPPFRELPHWASGVEDIAFSPDGKAVAAATWGVGERTLRIWDMATGKERCQLDNRERVGWIAFAPDGKLLASCGYDSVIKLWDVATGKKVRTLGEAEGSTRLLAFSPDGKFLAVWKGDFGSDAIIEVWEISTGQLARRLPGSQGFGALCFSPDGRLLASGSNDSTILLWDLTGRMKDGRLQPSQLSPQELDAHWRSLAGDGSGAIQALWDLVAAPQQALPLLKQHLHPAAPADPRRLARLLPDLDSDEFVVRERAEAEIERLGDAARPALQKALEGQPSIEAQRRIKRMLARLDEMSPERRRLLRAVTALEYIGTAEARQVLEMLAGGAAEARLTQEAKASLARLAARPASRP